MFDRQGETIAYAALRLYGAGRARVSLQLAPQPQHLNVDAAVEDILVDAGRLQKVLAGEGPSGRRQEGHQKRLFALGQGNGAARRVGEPTGAEIKLPAFETVATRGQLVV